MGTFGGRRAVARASALSALALTLAVPLVALTGCSGALDQAHTVQTHLNRIDEIESADVSTPSATVGPEITVTYDGSSSARELSRLIAAIDRVADGEDYPSYRLDLIPTDRRNDRLTVDDAFAGSPDEGTVLANWLSTSSVLLGDVHYRFESGQESIDVDSGAGILHDVGEASRIGYGLDGTTWTFHDGEDTFVVEGQVGPSDVSLFQDAARTLSSQALPAPASSWRLERRDDQLLLDLGVGLPGGPVPADQLTTSTYGDDVQRLAAVALAAARSAALPITLRLVNPAPAGSDVFGFWASDQRPVRGRDPLMRGWDRWLSRLAGQHA
ncbi:MAG: hypothetical protein WBP61_15740 [Nocardioides sp.]